MYRFKVVSLNFAKFYQQAFKLPIDWLNPTGGKKKLLYGYY